MVVEVIIMLADIQKYCALHDIINWVGIATKRQGCTECLNQNQFFSREIIF